MFIPEKSLYDNAKRREVNGEMVVVLGSKRDRRGLSLVIPISRALLRNEIHELILTDEQEAGPGKKVDRIAYIGFFEVKLGGIVVIGDKVFTKDKAIAEIAGFDETHMPNHLNIILKANKRLSGLELNLSPADMLTIKG